ncbi:MAG: undecaprenyl-diphosphate phosphatase, partial [Sinobacterium sp.]|nr:undecaprenyl-diphosphate phosphatase [Sinobacterium sp.]
MDYLHVFFLAFIQGITEFLPISSSAHLILPSKLLGFDDQGLAFDVAVHLGSLIAVIAYFRQDIVQLAKAWCNDVCKRQKTTESMLAWQIIIATIPAVITGFILNYLHIEMRSLLIIASTTILFGVVLGVADKMSQGASRERTTQRDAVLIGLAQCLALIP